jgi:DnaJ-class molecular chaperone
MRKCSKCGRTGRFKTDPCGHCVSVARQKELNKSTLPYANVVRGPKG